MQTYSQKDYNEIRGFGMAFGSVRCFMCGGMGTYLKYRRTDDVVLCRCAAYRIGRLLEVLHEEWSSPDFYSNCGINTIDSLRIELKIELGRIIEKEVYTERIGKRCVESRTLRHYLAKMSDSFSTSWWDHSMTMLPKHTPIHRIEFYVPTKIRKQNRSQCSSGVQRHTSVSQQ